ncbi:tetratricopeptide repeat protein [Nannocystaceae bacterium ST9]
MREGRVVHAEMPGATGELALELLGRVPDLRVEVAAASGVDPATVERPWLAILGSVADRVDDEHASMRRARVYAELRELGIGVGPALVALPPTPSYPAVKLRAARHVAASLLRRAGLLAYLADDLDRARRCYERALTLRPRDAASRVNAERIRARMLDGERTNEGPR